MKMSQSLVDGAHRQSTYSRPLVLLLVLILIPAALASESADQTGQTAQLPDQSLPFSYYEVVEFSSAGQTGRTKRHVGSSGQIIQLRTHGRSMSLLLEPEQDDSLVEFSSSSSNTIEEVPVNETSQLFTGIVLGLVNSVVVGRVDFSVEPARFYGYINLPDGETIVVESLDRYTGGLSHNVSAPIGCGLDHPDIRHQQDDLMLTTSEPFANVHGRHHNHRRHAGLDEEDPLLKYLPVGDSSQAGRHRRSATSQEKVRRICTVAATVDYPFYDKRRKEHSSYSARELMTLFFDEIKLHLAQISTMYVDIRHPSVPDFYLHGVDFKLKRVFFLDRANENEDRLVKLKQTNLDITKTLNYFSEDLEWEKFCIAVLYSNRDFSNSVLGLAWIGTQTGNAGLCARKHFNAATGKSVVQNTAVVTTRNQNRQQSSLSTTLTFAHEIGHLFGAEHDFNSTSGQAIDNNRQCAPYRMLDDSRGNYIMFPRSNAGSRPNNQKFSSCSKRVFVMRSQRLIKMSDRSNCFTKTDQPYCGNYVVEENEECDCGLTVSECSSDNCCEPGTPQLVDSKRACKRKSRAVCSPSEGPCCNGMTCQFSRYDQTKPCRDGDECTFPASCTGNEAACPPSKHRENGTICSAGKKTCFIGQCIGSLCDRVHPAGQWESCSEELDRSQGGYNEKMENACYLACRPKVNSSVATKHIKGQGHLECWNSANYMTGKNFPTEFRQFIQDYPNLLRGNNLTVPDELRLTDGPIKLIAGAACDKGLGFCDVFGKCNKVDSEGPLKRLTGLLFSQDSLNTVKRWIQEHWWAVGLICLGAIIVFGLFIKVFSVHTPSSNPDWEQRHPHYAIRDTLRRPIRRTTNRRSRSGPARRGPSTSAGGPSTSAGAGARSVRSRSADERAKNKRNKKNKGSSRSRRPHDVPSIGATSSAGAGSSSHRLQQGPSGSRSRRAQNYRAELPFAQADSIRQVAQPSEPAGSDEPLTGFANDQPPPYHIAMSDIAGSSSVHS